MANALTLGFSLIRYMYGLYYIILKIWLNLPTVTVRMYSLCCGVLCAWFVRMYSLCLSGLFSVCGVCQDVFSVYQDVFSVSVFGVRLTVMTLIDISCKFPG